MQKSYLDRLPDDVRFFVKQIEQDSGVEITVKVDPSRASGSPDCPGRLGCKANEHCAQILIPKCDHFPDASVLHELFHIRRFLVNGIPRIISSPTYDNWTPELKDALGSLDNSLDHLVIVPQELECRPKRKSHWKDRVLSALQSGNISNGDVLLNWVFIQHVLPDRNLIDKASELILRRRIKDYVTLITESLISSLSSKERTVKLCFKHLNIPEEAGCLEYIDSKIGRSRIRYLADVSMDD